MLLGDIESLSGDLGGVSIVRDARIKVLCSPLLSKKLKPT